jgi:hypothetical protein
MISGARSYGRKSGLEAGPAKRGFDSRRGVRPPGRQSSWYNGSFDLSPGRIIAVVVFFWFRP